MILTINKELEKILKKLAKENTIAEDILNYRIDTETKYINYLGTSETTSGYISYLTKGKIESPFVKEEDYWKGTIRLHKNPAGVVELLFPNVHTQRAKEIFTERYRNVIQQGAVKDDKFKIVEGNDIAKYYLQKRYIDSDEEDGGSLHSSCMRYVTCQDYFDLYTMNKQTVSMAILFDASEKVRARCILWYPEGKESSKVWYDRIYGASTNAEKEMQALLEAKGFINVSPKNIIKPLSENIKTLNLQFGHKEIEYFPYVDTFAYIKDKKISTDKFTGSYTMQDTEGGIEDDRSDCARCGDHVNDNDLHQVITGSYSGSHLCDDCVAYSAHYEGYLCTSNCTYVESEQDYYLDGDIRMDFRGDYILRSDAVELWNTEYAHREQETILTAVDGSKFVLDDDNFVEVVGKGWYHSDDENIEEIDGTYYLIGSDEYEKTILLMEEEI